MLHMHQLFNPFKQRDPTPDIALERHNFTANTIHWIDVFVYNGIEIAHKYIPHSAI